MRTIPHPAHSQSPWVAVLLLSGWYLLTTLCVTTQAQVKTALTSDRTLDTTVTRYGTVYDITGGRRPDNGPNLFHSFERFTVGTKDTARFTAANPVGIENILSRVTGGQESVIDGRIQSTIPGANLFLLNPAGVLFGPHASLDVSGSFHVSTADFLRFTDGATFFADRTKEGGLTIAPLAAFGFLSKHPAKIRLQESMLEVPTGKTLSVVGGNIEIVGGHSGFLSAPSGQINLVSVASAGEVVFSSSEQVAAFNVDSFQRLGEITISEGAHITVSGNSSGTMVIRGNRLQVDGASIRADTLGSGDPTEKGIDIAMTENVVVTNSGRITTEGVGTGDAGDIVVEAATVVLDAGAQLSSSTFGPGRGGSVTVRATDTVTMQGISPDGSFRGSIIARARGTGAVAGTAGDIVVEATTVRVDAGAQISSSTFGPGRGGSVTVRATDTVVISDAESGLSANATGSGNAGSIRLMAAGIVLRENSTVSTQASQADGGDIEVTAQSIVHLRDSAITATVGGGATTVGGNIVIDPEFVILDNSQIIANAFEGQGGNISITARVLLADPRSSVSASSELGIDGTVDIRVPVTNLSGTIAPLPQRFEHAIELLRGRCAERIRDGHSSSFVVARRDGLPVEPGSMLPSPLVFTEEQRSATARRQSLQPPPRATLGRQLNGDAAGRLQVRGWRSPTFLQTALDLECARWQRAQEMSYRSKTP